MKLKLSRLLSQRNALLQQARLANLAFACATLDEFAGRIARAQLGGMVCLRRADPSNARFDATLTALAGSQAVIEEHFSEEEINDLADILAFLTGDDALETNFSLEALEEKFLRPVQLELEFHGVVFDGPASAMPPI